MTKLLLLGIILLAVAQSAGLAQVDLGTITLINGDVNGDNAITNADLDMLLPNLDLTSANGDLDGDGLVTTSDLSIVLKNMGTVGDQ